MALTAATVAFEESEVVPGRARFKFRCPVDLMCSALAAFEPNVLSQSEQKYAGV